ncbi:MAG: DNA-packaging protein [Oscillospiraceae bacterium]|nr:DNA-packaging protein [Oscillospiraceae bacterium]
MTDAEKIEMVKAMTGETEESTVSGYLYLAGQKILRMVCGDTVTAVPEKYDGLHVEAACYLLNRRGAEGEISHGENGVSREYESADLPAALLRSYGICGKAEVVT